MVAARSFDRFVLVPPFPAFDAFKEPATRSLLWRNLELPAMVPANGRALFSGTLAQRNAVLRDFRNFLRQARAYDDGAAHVAGSSAALLSYYSALNLAKAELLRTVPGRVRGVRIHHGLSFNPARARTVAGDAVYVQDGVFPLLYEKRTGRTLPTGTRLPIRRLLANIPEVGWELVEAGLGPVSCTSMLHGVVTDGSDAWSVVALSDPSGMQRNTVTRSAFLRLYEEVDRPTNWRDVFAVSRRYSGRSWTFYEERAPRPATTVGGDWDFRPEVAAAASGLRDLVDPSIDETAEATFCPSLYASRLLPMPSSLARYAVMFYVSSLVRYRPAHLDPQSNGHQAWLMDAFAEQAAVPLLQAALDGLSDHPVLFYSRNAFRL